MNNTCHLEISEGIATLTMDNPPQNRLSPALLAALEAAVVKLTAMSDVRAVILAGNGEHFSFGGDISIWPGVSPAEMKARISRSLQRASLFENLDVPVVAAVQGNCFGGGFEYALRCDIIVASSDALFSHSESALGIFTLLGGVQRTAQRAGRAKAMKWALTAERVPAQEMLEAGVINEVVDKGQHLARAQEWAKTLTSGATQAHVAHKRLLRAWASNGVEAADALIPGLTQQVFSTEDASRGVASAVDALNRGVERPIVQFEGK